VIVAVTLAALSVIAYMLLSPVNVNSMKLSSLRSEIQKVTEGFREDLREAADTFV